MLAVNKGFDHTRIIFSVKHTYLLQSIKTKHTHNNSYLQSITEMLILSIVVK